MSSLGEQRQYGQHHNPHPPSPVLTATTYLSLAAWPARAWPPPAPPELESTCVAAAAPPVDAPPGSPAHGEATEAWCAGTSPEEKHRPRVPKHNHWDNHQKGDLDLSRPTSRYSCTRYGPKSSRSHPCPRPPPPISTNIRRTHGHTHLWGAGDEAGAVPTHHPYPPTTTRLSATYCRPIFPFPFPLTTRHF